jgi:hypothetical protein
VLQADVAASPTAVFSAITADPSAWTWFLIRVQGHLAGPGSPGVGSTREFGVFGARFRETILACEPPTRWAYRGDLGSLPLVRALMELWTLEDHHGRTTVRWTLVADPRSCRGRRCARRAVAAPAVPAGDDPAGRPGCQGRGRYTDLIADRRVSAS